MPFWWRLHFHPGDPDVLKSIGVAACAERVRAIEAKCSNLRDIFGNLPMGDVKVDAKSGPDSLAFLRELPLVKMY